MNSSLPPLDAVHLIIVIIWIIYYCLRLLQHSHNHVFLKMPWLILWINGYVFGWCYILNNYSVQIYLQHAFLPLTNFPITIIVKLVVYSLVYFIFFFTMRFYSPYHKAWYREVILITSICVSCIVLTILWMQSQPFHILFWVGDILLFVNAMLALVMLLQVSRRFKDRVIPTIEYIHFIWFAGCVLFAGISLTFTTFSAIDGLITQRLFVRDIWLEIGYLTYTFALICMAGLTSPDEFLYRTGYPLRLLRIRKLNRLYFYILSSILVTEHYPISPYRVGQNAEHAIYERVISILDMYPFLDSNDDIFQELKRIENQHDVYLDCAEALIHVTVPDFKIY
jgi:hypothetical protein